MSQTAQDQSPDPFLQAFERLSALGETPSPVEVDTALTGADTVQGGQGTAPAAEGQGTAAGAEGADAGAEGQDTAAGGEGQDTAAGAEGQDTPTGADKAPAKDDDDLLRRLSDLVRKGAPAESEKPAPAKADDGKEPEPPPPIYTKEEEDFLATYEKDWPDVAKAEALRRRGEYKQLVSFVFQEVGAFLKPHLETLQAVATQTHLSDISTQVPDYEDVRDKVIDWVGQQPAYLQRAYQHVINEGTAEEVLDLIGRWREATGASATQQPTQPPRAEKTALPPATKQAAAALAPVGSKRTAPAFGVDPTDFDGAFVAAAQAKD